MVTTHARQAEPLAPPAPPADNSDATLVPRRRPGHIGAVNVVQIAVAEAVLLVVLSMLRHTLWLLVAGVLGGLLLVVLTFGRHRGRWWTEHIALRWQYRRRTRSGQEPTEDHRLALLHELVPDLTVHNVEGSGGVRIGVGCDAAGWFVVLEVTPTDGMSGAARQPLPLDALAKAIKDVDQPGVVLQVVTHSVPAPSDMEAASQPSSRSYCELVQPVGGSVPADQVSWISVRLDARTLAEAAVGAEDAAQAAPVVLAALIRPAGKTLKRAGLAYRILDADAVMDALALSLALDAMDQTRPHELWRRWQSTRLGHVSFWLQRWPAVGAAEGLLSRLAGTQSAFTTVATIVEPREDGIDLRCLVRVAADPMSLDATCAELQMTAKASGARLFRLDGEHAPAAYASAPSGGGAL